MVPAVFNQQFFQNNNPYSTILQVLIVPTPPAIRIIPTIFNLKRYLSKAFKKGKDNYYQGGS